MLNFKKCPISGQLVAQGEKAQYWIDDSVLTNMRTVVITAHGPVITKWVPQHDVDIAKAEAETMEVLVCGRRKHEEARRAKNKTG